MQFFNGNEMDQNMEGKSKRRQRKRKGILITHDDKEGGFSWKGRGRERERKGIHMNYQEERPKIPLHLVYTLKSSIMSVLLNLLELNLDIAPMKLLPLSS